MHAATVHVRELGPAATRQHGIAGRGADMGECNLAALSTPRIRGASHVQPVLPSFVALARDCCQCRVLLV